MNAHLSHGFQCEHDALLVILSYMISVFGAYCALQLAAQIPAEVSRVRSAWLSGAAIAMGGGAIWSMHFIAMMACRLPVPVAYDGFITVASLLVAIVVTGVGLAVVSRAPGDWRRLAAGGSFTGLGVAAMHYTGMTALRMPARTSYRPGLVILSVVIAMVAATAALWLAFHLRGRWQRLSASLVMGVAVCGMHYTGMAATVFIPDRGANLLPAPGVGLKPSDLGFMVFGITLFVLTLMSVGSSIVDARRRRADLVRIRAELELKVADRTSELARANEDLKREIEERERLHAESVLLTAFSAEVGAALTRAESHGEALRLCAESMVRHLGADMASVWTLESEGTLDLAGQAWARRPQFAPDARVPIGESPIGRVALERKPLFLGLTAGTKGDNDEDWAQREGMVEFVGHPLVVGEQLVGVMAMYSKRPPNAAAVQALAAVADGIALGIARENSVEALRVSEASNRAVIDNMLTGLITTDERSVIETFNPAAERLFGYSASEIVGRHLSMLLPSEASAGASEYLRQARDRALGQVTEWPARRRNGEVFTMELALFEFQTPDRRRHYAGSVRDVSTAREVERLKGEFVSTVSHELRTPLTSIRGALGLVNGGAAGEIPDRARALLDIAYQNTERLSLLVNDILDLEKLESGRMDLHVEPLHASIFLESLVEANQPYAIPYGVRLEFVPYGSEVWILADRDRLGQVVTNLVSNAIKFSPRGETVTVSLSRDAARGRVRMTVADRGPGIPDAFRAKIFQRFQQADSSDTRQKGGTGLGLAITKSIVERLGGEISFQSTAGAGTSFHVDLPESTSAASALVTPSKPVEARAPALRILVCDDDPDQANRLSLILQDAGCRTEVARDAAAAKALLSERHFDAMTLDIGLPGQDGISLIQELRAGTETRALPIVVVSLDPERGRSQLSGDAFGILDWLDKPVDSERLLAAVGRAGEGARARPRILHVEDDPDILTLLTTLVQSRADVVSVKTCGEGKRALAEGDFDLLVLDLELPDGRGLDLLPLLHRAGRRPTPVIVFSAHSLSRAMAFDIEAVLTKSQTSNEEILRTIESLVKLPRAGAA